MIAFVLILPCCGEQHCRFSQNCSKLCSLWHRHFPGFAKGQTVSGTHLQELHPDITTKLSPTDLLCSSTHSSTTEVIFKLRVTHVPGQSSELPSWAPQLLPAHSEEMGTPLEHHLDKFVLGLTAKLILLRDLGGSQCAGPAWMWRSSSRIWLAFVYSCSSFLDLAQ